MTGSLPPGVILIFGSLLVAFLRGRRQQVCLLALPILSAFQLIFFLPSGATSWSLFGYELTPIHVDRLSLVWGSVFHLAAFLCALYSLHVKDRVQHISALVYAGAAIGAVFAGDLLTLFVYWELTAISSVFLIWASRSERSYRAGMRYLLVQVASGVLLLSGILLHLRNTRGSTQGSLAFLEAFHRSLPEVDSLFLGLNSIDTVLIFAAFGIKAAFPLVHSWVQDAYPEATPTGTVFLSAFTTKLAIYALARGFPGTGCLIWIGAVMTVVPLVYALIENDLRRVLAFSLNNQLGFMVVGVGLANFLEHPETAQLALNGTAGHAFAHVLYKSLLFMTIGAVYLRTGTAKCTELGGLYRSMPWTAGFCVVGAASIAAVPLFSGFVTKSMILTALAEEHHTLAWLVLLFAAAAAVLPDLKVPLCAFFGRDRGLRPAEAPTHMLVAMGMAAACCVAIGVVPVSLYWILPYEVDYPAYTFTHLVTQSQLLLWAVLAFVLLKKIGIYPIEVAGTNLDSDWFYRRPFVRRTGQRDSLVAGTVSQLARWRTRIWTQAYRWVQRPWAAIIQQLQPDAMLASTSSVSAMVVWAAALLTAYLVLYYTAG